MGHECIDSSTTCCDLRCAICSCCSCYVHTALNTCGAATSHICSNLARNGITCGCGFAFDVRSTSANTRALFGARDCGKSRASGTGGGCSMLSGLSSDLSSSVSDLRCTINGRHECFHPGRASDVVGDLRSTGPIRRGQCFYPSCDYGVFSISSDVCGTNKCSACSRHIFGGSNGYASDSAVHAASAGASNFPCATEGIFARDDIRCSAGDVHRMSSPAMPSPRVNAPCRLAEPLDQGSAQTCGSS